MAARILYIDDEEDIRTIASMALELDGSYEVQTAASGEAGLAQAASWKPALILLDVRMPGMDGPTTLSRLRADPATADIPVVFFTASVQKAQRQELLSQGAAGMIEKPFDPMTLPALVEPYLSGHKQ